MRVWQGLAAAATVGLFSLLLVPLERIVPIPAPALIVRVLALIQPAILTMVAIAVGCALAPRVTLGAPLIEAIATGRPTGPVLRCQLPPALLVALAIAPVLIAYQIYAAPLLIGHSPLAQALTKLDIPLATRLLYGGIVEEVLTRWGLVSLLAWIGWRLAGRPVTIGAVTYIAAIVLAALAFGFGHLPILLAMKIDPSAWLTAAVVLGNAVPGIAFGWLFWRRGIEAAMMAHATTHLVAALVVG